MELNRAIHILNGGIGEEIQADEYHAAVEFCKLELQRQRIRILELEHVVDNLTKESDSLRKQVIIQAKYEEQIHQALHASKRERLSGN